MTFSLAQNVFIWRKPDIFNVVEQGGADFTGRVGCSALFKKFLEAGLWLKVPNGRYFVDANVLATLTKGFVLEGSPNAEFFCDNLQGDFFRDALSLLSCLMEIFP